MISGKRVLDSKKLVLDIEGLCYEESDPASTRVMDVTNVHAADLPPDWRRSFVAPRPCQVAARTVDSAQEHCPQGRREEIKE